MKIHLGTLIVIAHKVIMTRLGYSFVAPLQIDFYWKNGPKMIDNLTMVILDFHTSKNKISDKSKQIK